MRLRAFAVQFLTLVGAYTVAVEVVGDPGDGAGEAFLQFDFGGPAEVVSGFGVVGEEAQDFGFGGADSFWVLDYWQIRFVEDFEDEVGDFADGDFGAGAEVELVAE